MRMTMAARISNILGWQVKTDGQLLDDAMILDFYYEVDRVFWKKKVLVGRTYFNRNTQEWIHYSLMEEIAKKLTTIYTSKYIVYTTDENI